MIENEPEKNMKLLYGAMENQQRITVEFIKDSTRYAFQGYVLSLSNSFVVIEEYEGDKEDGIRIEFLRDLVSVRLISTELKELEQEIIKEMEENIRLVSEECSVDIVTPYDYAGREVVKKLDKISRKYNYEILAVGVRNGKLFFTIMKL